MKRLVIQPAPKWQPSLLLCCIVIALTMVIASTNHVEIHPKPEEDADFLPVRPKIPLVNGYNQNGTRRH